MLISTLVSDQIVWAQTTYKTEERLPSDPKTVLDWKTATKEAVDKNKSKG